jgi:hypothetical protein
MGEGDSECKCPHCSKGLPCTAKACPHCKQSIDKIERGEDEKAFVSYKSADGAWRWLSLSNWAVVDKEAEVVSEQAYRDAIAYAQKSGDWGQLDEVHIDGTDVGDADTLFILKGGHEPATFGAAGTWHDTAQATKAREAIQADPAYWGVSIKFRFNPAHKFRGVYTGDIQVLKHSILPQTMAASYGTAIAVQGGEQMKQMDANTAEALRKLGRTEDEIAELAEKQKAVPEEDNIVEKEETTPETPETLWDKLGKMIGIGQKEVAPVASEPEEAEKAEEVSDPATAAEPAETKQAGDETPETEKAELETPDAGALIRALGETVAKSVGTMVKEELDVQDKRIAALEAQVRDLSESVEEKVEQRLRDVPTAVKVAASQADATVAIARSKGLTFQQKGGEMAEFSKSLLADIEQLVKDKTPGAPFQV